MISRKTIEEAEKKLFAAMQASDVAVLDKLLHDDLLALVPGGKVLSKSMDLDAHRAGTMLIENAVIAIEDIKIMGDIAISITSMKAKGKMMGTPVEGHFRYIRFWKNFDSGLQVTGAGIYQVN